MVGAATELVEPTITVRWNELVCAVPFTVSDRPVGAVLKVRSTVRGSSWTEVVSAWPSESVAVSCSSRNEGHSWSGATNEPAPR